MITCLEKHCFSTNCYRILSKPACIFLSAGFVALLIRNYPCLIQLTHTLSKAWCLQSIILDLVYSGAGEGEGQVWNHQKPLEYEWSALWFGVFPSSTSGKEPACQCSRCKRQGFDPWVWKIPRRRKWQPTPGSLPGESHGQRSLVGCSP